jgi:DNA-binding response OmpR family regulator
MKTILIADSDRRLRKGISSLLKKRGFRIVELIDINPLTEFENPLDIAIINLETTFNDNEQLVTALKKLVRHNTLPIITTIKEDSNLIEKMTECNEAQFMEKPFSFKELIERIDTHLKTIKKTAAVKGGKEEQNEKD